MMSNDIVVRARIDSDTKERATAVLEPLGLSVADAIRLLLSSIAEEKRLPFAVRAPNATTARALAELDAGQGKRFDSAEALFRDLGV